MKHPITCLNCSFADSIGFASANHRIRHHGGWLAPNIYFLGIAGCVQVNGLRIAGASGIFKPHDFRSGKQCRPVSN